MKVKATVHVTITLPAGAELVGNFRADGQDLGPHIKVGGKLFRPFINWLVCLPRYLQTPTELGLGKGPVWITCEMRDYEAFLSDEEDAGHPYTLEVVG